MTVREPEFNDADRAQFFVDYENQHEPKSSTGVPWSIASEPANRGRFGVEAEIDFALEARQRAVAEYQAMPGDNDLSAYVFSVVPPPTTE